MIGVKTITLNYWELGRSNPETRLIPNIIKFVGYVPYDVTDMTWGEKIVTYRKIHGLSQKQLACDLCIDPATLGRWERNERELSKAVKKLLAQEFSLSMEEKN